MRFRFIGTLLLVVLALAVSPKTASAAEQVGGFTVVHQGGGVVITDYSGSDSMLNIDYVGGSPVVGVGNGAFRNCDKLVSVSFGPRITYVGNSAFSGCDSLLSVSCYRATSLTSIGDYAFSGCGSLYDVSCYGATSLTSIGEAAFIGCSSLNYISLPDSLRTIQDSTFERCSSLKSISLPSSISTIGDGAFINCSSLNSVSLPDSVRYIESSAFEGCSSLKSISLPSSISTIGDGAFRNCSSLRSVVIYPGVGTIYDEAFLGLYDPSTITVAKQAHYDFLQTGRHPSLGYLGKQVSNYTTVVLDNSFLPDIADASVALDSDRFAYDGTEKRPQLTVAYNGKTLRDGVDYRVDFSDNVGPGVAFGTICGTGDYRGTRQFSFEIVQSIDRPAPVLNLTYTGEEQVGVCEGAGYTLSGCPSATDASDYFAEAALNDGYVWSDGSSDPFEIEWSIEPADIAVTSVSPIGSQLYTATFVEPAPSLSFNGRDLVEGVDYIVAYDSNVEVGVGRAEVTGMGNYTGSVEASFEILSNATRFTDTPASAWYVANGTLDYVIARGIMSGTSATTFDPGGQVTRAQVATILYNLTGRPAVGEAEAFSDVEAGSWYHDAVMWARSAGVVSGYDDGSFKPGVSVTREQLACMLRNYAGNVARLDVSVGSGGLSGFADAASVSSWAYDSVAWCAGRGIIAGTPSGGSVFVNPQGTAARAEAAQMVRAFDEKVLGV